MDLSNYRKNYESRKYLIEQNIPTIPIELFHSWFQEEKKMSSNDQEVNTMSISTIGKDGAPETRIVLLKQYSEKGFIFYTNYLSAKGLAIQQNPQTCISFYFYNTNRQILIKGKTFKLNIQQSDRYFNERPREHKIGSWASKQSTIIPSKEYLLDQYNKWKIFFKKCIIIKRPFDWGGYIVKPYKMEFWQGQPYRLHDRLVYYLETDKKWNVFRLSP
ncbi:pyridoxamine 5'-phosphate oxidase [Blattabacterium cuenoti]|uniref:pyridoxamine 5'-phosphate oxidase n=1 Tax=Blattabacterium cuenoti TaxID=1653831 RepID=UPI00163CE1E9|nr:pyridoxamine 5'-phosphate oxidase [Blattabacterium cuenoti]